MKTRPLSTFTAYEAFSESRKTNWGIIDSMSTVRELKDMLNTMPYFADSGYVSDYGWLAFPIDAASYVLAIFQFDPETGMFYLSHFDKHFISKNSSAEDEVALSLLFHHSSKGATDWSVPAIREAVLAKNPEYSDKSDDEIVDIFNKNKSFYFSEDYFSPVLDDYMQPFFAELKAKVKPYYAPANGAYGADTVSFVQEAVNEMLKNGGEVTFNGLTGLPVYISDVGGRLRVRTNDGVHGVAFVQFPKSARTEEALYIVPKSLVGWSNGFYHISNSLPLDKYAVKK